MRDGRKPPDPISQHEIPVVQSAVRFANSRQPEEKATAAWAKDQYKKLGVLPPRTPYFIDDLGRIFARQRSRLKSNDRIWNEASVVTVEKWWAKLRSTMGEIVLDSWEAPVEVAQRAIEPEILTSKNGTKTALLIFPKEGWTRSIVNGLSVEATSQAFIPPTIDAFVTYAAVLLSKKPWRTRLYRCVQCGRYFFNPLNKRGRRRHVCGDRCNEERGDPTSAARSRKYRNDPLRKLARKG